MRPGGSGFASGSEEADRMEDLHAGDLVWGGFDGADAPADLLERIQKRRLGGVILLGRSIKDPGQVATLTNRLRAVVGDEPPLPVAIDQEGGRVQRLRAPATEWPPMARLGARD